MLAVDMPTSVQNLTTLASDVPEIWLVPEVRGYQLCAGISRRRVSA